jgi:uncharacterized membrane protein YfcA
VPNADSDDAAPAPKVKSVAPTAGRVALILGAVGVLFGGIGSFAGIGGGLMVMPMLLALGFPHARAVGTSFVFLFTVTLTALATHAQLDNVHLDTGLALGVGGLVGTQIGSRLVSRISARRFQQLFAGVVFLGAISMVAKAMGLLGPTAEAVAAGTRIELGIWFVPIGVGVGIAAAFAGIGGGVFVVPLLLFLGYTHMETVGTSFLSMLVVATGALVAHLRRRSVALRTGLPLAIGGAIGAPVGAQLVGLVDRTGFQVTFAALLLVFGALLLRRATRKPKPTPAPADAASD